jgi:Rod binding domain-containing protein
MSGIQSISPTVGGMLAGEAEQLSNRTSDSLEMSSELAAKFESIFTSLLLKEMRQSVGEGGLFGGDSSDVFGGLFDLYMGEHVAKSTSLGIGDMVSKYVNAQKSSNAEQPPV